MDNLTPQEAETTDIRASLEASFNAAETSEVTEVQADQTIGDDVIADEAKADRTRDEKGKLAKTASETDVKTTETGLEATETPQPKPSPKSLKKELADKHWATLAPELQDALLQRDADYEKGIEGYRTSAERGQAFEKIVSPYMATIQSLGATPEQAVGELLRSDYILRSGSPQQKMQMMAQIFRDYAIDPMQTFNYLQNGAPQIDPAIAPVYQELQTLRQQQERLVREQQERENQALTSEIERAKVGKEHFDAVRDDMAALLQAGRATDLDDAYDKAIWARPDLRASLLQQEREKAMESARSTTQAARSQAAAVSVKGSSPVQTTAQPENLRDLIASQF
jgi:hypothetical protein